MKFSQALYREISRVQSHSGWQHQKKIRALQVSRELLLPDWPLRHKRLMLQVMHFEDRDNFVQPVPNRQVDVGPQKCLSQNEPRPFDLRFRVDLGTRGEIYYAHSC